MSDHRPITKPAVHKAADSLTTEWSPSAQPNAAQLAATFTRDRRSTSGPNNLERQTLTRDGAFEVRDPSPQFPELPDLRIEEFLDCGGMGRVYKAFQNTLNRTVAVKIITATARDGMIPRERFRREVELLAQITHPNVVPIYTAGEWHGFPYYTMKFIAGGTLAKHLDRLAGDTPAIVRIMSKVARGLQALHERGIIHRDLKPLNILMDGDEPVIADFGLAKWLDDSDSEVSRTDAAIGTRHYMSPEQSVGAKRAYGPGCDIWSFGVTLYEMLVGRRPFRDDLTPDIFAQIRLAEPDIPASVTADLAAILRRCLQKDPKGRYPSAAELAEDLDRHLAGQPVVTPLSTRRHVAPPRNRHWPILAGVAVALLAAASLGLAIRPTPKPTAAKKSISERLRAGETVTLIPSKGPPVEAARPPDEVNNPLSTDPDGHCRLGSVGIATHLLTEENIGVPFVLSCECALASTRQSQAYAGLIFGHRQPTPDGPPARGYLQLVQQIAAEPDPDGKSPVVERATIDAVNWGGVSRSRNQIGAIEAPPPDKGEGAGPEWRRMQVRIERDSARASWEGIGFPPLGAGGVLQGFPPIESREPGVGHGLGLTAYHTDALFRNFTLMPASSSQP